MASLLSDTIARLGAALHENEQAGNAQAQLRHIGDTFR